MAIQAKIQNRPGLSDRRSGKLGVATHAVGHAQRLPETRRSSNAANWAALGVFACVALWICYYVALDAAA
jgi:hypothetical protein